MRTLACILAFLSLASAALAATPLDIAEGGLSLTVPTGWTAANEGTRCVIASADGGVLVVVAVAEATQVQGVLDAMKRNQSAVMSNIRAQQSQYRLNGLDVYEERGTADSRDGPCLWKIEVVRAARPVIVYTLTSPSALRANESDYAALMRSMRRM